MTTPVNWYSLSHEEKLAFMESRQNRVFEELTASPVWVFSDNLMMLAQCKNCTYPGMRIIDPSKRFGIVRSTTATICLCWDCLIAAGFECTGERRNPHSGTWEYTFRIRLVPKIKNAASSQ